MEAQRNTQGSSKEISYSGVGVGVDRDTDGLVKLVFVLPGETHIFPLTPEGATALGRELTAPSVIVSPADALRKGLL